MQFNLVDVVWPFFWLASALKATGDCLDLSHCSVGVSLWRPGALSTLGASGLKLCQAYPEPIGPQNSRYINSLGLFGRHGEFEFVLAAAFAQRVVAIAAGCRGIFADVCETREQGVSAFYSSRQTCIIILILKSCYSWF